MRCPLLCTIAVAVSACTTTIQPVADPVAPIDLPILGSFVDDYGNAFRISATLFEQRPSGRFHIVEWHEQERFFVARNDAANPSDGGLWTRIDWMPLSEMAPYTWGFCMTAYRAVTRELARATPPPNRATPRTGCNGFPFSRMRPATSEDPTMSSGPQAERPSTPPLETAMLPSDKLAGDWVMTGTIGTDQVVHDVKADWILGRRYLRIHDLSREKEADGSPAYEARIPFVWRSADGSGIRNTFSFERTSDSRAWAIDNVDTSGRSSPFARVTLRRQ